MQIDRVGVVGHGLMGSGIAEVVAHRGLDVVVVDGETRRRQPRPTPDRGLVPTVRRGKFDAETAARSIEAVRFSTDREVLADRHRGD